MVGSIYRKGMRDFPIDVIFPEPQLRNPFELGKHEAPLTPWELAALQESAGQVAVNGSMLEGGKNA